MPCWLSAGTRCSEVDGRGPRRTKGTSSSSMRIRSSLVSRIFLLEPKCAAHYMRVEHYANGPLAFSWSFLVFSSSHIPEDRYCRRKQRKCIFISFFFSFLLLIRIFSRSSGHYYLKSVRNLSECRKNATLNTTVSRYKRSNRNGNSKKSKVIIDSKYSRYCWKLLFQIKTKLGFYAMAFSKEPRSKVV